MVPNLVFTSGSTANMQDGLLLHHFVIFNPAQTGIGCPISEPFFGAGNERTHLHLPSPYGYHNTSATWNMIVHLVNKNPVPQTVNIEVVYRWRPVAGTESARPAWLDIDSICNGGNSEYTIPTGLLRHAQRLDRAAERAHHRHVRPPARHRHHRPESVSGALRVTRGGDRAQRGASGRRRQRLLRADPAQQPAARGHHGRDAVPVRGVSRDRGRDDDAREWAHGHDGPVRDLRRGTRRGAA